jgi:hypothetical protein
MTQKLNRSSAHALLRLLAGKCTVSETATSSDEAETRSVQRALARLVDLGLTQKHGPSNNPSYTVEYANLICAEIPEKIIEDEERPESTLNQDLIAWLHTIELADFAPLGLPNPKIFGDTSGAKISQKDLEYLTVELSWKSSALEGNTYSLLDTQLLLLEGVKAQNKTEFETQMILNHKNAIVFILENGELFEHKISFSTVEELHRIIGYNLGISAGVRKRLVKITASNYTPIANPHQLKEFAEEVLDIVSSANGPMQKALLALSLVPYLQVFEDGNKRTGRMLANAILINTIGKGFSLRKVSAKQLAMAYLAFYEFNTLQPLAKILNAELSSNV